MNAFGTVLALSVIAQFAVERLKTPIPSKYTKVAVPLLALALCCILTCSCRVGVLSALGINIDNAPLDYLLTGILISGGSTAFNELIKVLNGLKEGLQSVER